MTDRRRQLETTARRCANKIRTDLPPGAGFALLVFDFGPRGFMAYISNAEREDMIRALREQIARLEAGTSATKGEA